jgi:hypothetical protein
MVSKKGPNFATLTHHQLFCHICPSELKPSQYYCFNYQPNVVLKTLWIYQEDEPEKAAPNNRQRQKSR